MGRPIGSNCADALSGNRYDDIVLTRLFFGGMRVLPHALLLAWHGAVGRRRLRQRHADDGADCRRPQRRRRSNTGTFPNLNIPPQAGGRAAHAEEEQAREAAPQLQAAQQQRSRRPGARKPRPAQARSSAASSLARTSTATRR